MSYLKVKKYAESAVANIIPLDPDSCKELVDYALTLPSNQAIQNHFLNMLGETEESLKFITKFLQLKQEEDAASKPQKPKRQEAKPKATSSGSNAWISTPSPPKEPVRKGRLDRNKSSHNTSELLDLKPSNQLSSQQVKKNKKKNLDNLKDIEAILTELELKSSNETNRRCNCMATRHPLFEMAPNCLNCGKIICVKEGLQPCSFCGHELLNHKERLEIMNVLRQEKDELENKQDNLQNKKIQEQKTTLSKPKSKKIVVSMNAGENLWKAQDRALKQAELEAKRAKELEDKKEAERKEVEEQEEELKKYELSKQVNPDLLKAQERLETLLNFQSTGAERTKIIDNAADYQLPSSGGSMWLSPVERALQLKKQQKILRKHEESIQARSGRGKVTVEMVIKNGKVTMVEKQHTGRIVEDKDEEINALEEELQQEKQLHEQDLSKNIWDYEKDQKKWERPVYMGKAPGNDSIEVKHGRVQFAFDPEENELL
ncbi:zf-C2HC5-domain-containing protein [Suhomyces tanzawaensis NRRL Y-17324]|uniref:Zf-C2HC5-domain-containing protein n=1 Tax=Suhomyces tanzawaensis NRRL Y-17324 TaxID=984487 RepID=A0A1E4SEK9_9ASCO|nr:zf-C2HC5-domain-containing protein [Suhomyces tanzawaensis NRRL Y-17324]ODV77896.1 zf-C2HC5-domain-containing protein [Suhomyces tanzawaensis NRRL Y-17324]